jgi:hypothetical protein
MTHRYKVAGLAFVAMVALGAFMAHGASAISLTCEGIVPGGTCYTFGDQDGGKHEIASAGGVVSCIEASFSGEGVVSGVGGAVNEETVAPSYPTEKAGGGNNCTAFGFAGAHIKMNECKYTFTTPKALPTTGQVTYRTNSEEFPLHFTCPTGKQMEITPTFLGASVCTQFIPAQTPTGGHVIGKSAGTQAEMDVTKEKTLKGIHYTGTGSSCGNSETHSDATLTGNSTVRCFTDLPHIHQVGCTYS